MAVWYLLGRHLKRSWREPIWIAVELTQPIIWLALYGQLFQKVTMIPGFGSSSYVQFLTPGVIVMTSLFGSAWAGMTFIEDYREGVMDRLLAIPIWRQSIILSKTLHAGITVGVQTLIILGVGTLLGARVEAGIGGILIIILTTLLLGGGFSAASNGLALLTRKEDTLIAVLNFATLPLMFLSATLMSSSLMPGWMQNLSHFNPVNWATVAARAGLTGPIAGTAWLELMYLAFFLVAANLFAAWSLRRFQTRN